jgi:hypothetical protein
MDYRYCVIPTLITVLPVPTIVFKNTNKGFWADANDPINSSYALYGLTSVWLKA